MSTVASSPGDEAMGNVAQTMDAQTIAQTDRQEGEQQVQIDTTYRFII